MYQPGERWLYHTSADVLGVLIARAAGQTFDAFLAERVLGPLGMVDTGFAVPADRRDRFGACFGVDPATGERTVYDPAEGQWASPPAFPGGGAGLVSTLADLHAFGEALLAGGVRQGERLLSRTHGGGDDHQPAHTRAGGHHVARPGRHERVGVRRRHRVAAYGPRPAAGHLRLGRRARQLVGERPVRGPDRRAPHEPPHHNRPRCSATSGPLSTPPRPTNRIQCPRQDS